MMSDLTRVGLIMIVFSVVWFFVMLVCAAISGVPLP